jgi:hypothetical protein
MYLGVFSRLDECLTKTIKANWLLFIDQRRTAYSLGFKVDRNLHRSAVRMNGMPPSIPKSFRSKAMTPLIS